MVSDWALVKIINSVETVDGVIVAEPEVAATYLVANSGDYDYVLDVSLYSPTPGIGYTYDAGNDTFTPPAEDFEGELEAALVAVDTALENALYQYELASPEDRSTAVGNVMSELSDESQNEIDAMTAVITYLEAESGE